MNFIEELDNQNNCIQKEIEAHIPEMELSKRFIEYIKTEIKAKMSRGERFLRGFPFYCPDCYWSFKEVASKAKARQLVSQEYYSSSGKLTGGYMHRYGDDACERYSSHAIDVPYFETFLQNELISLGCEVKEVEVLSAALTGQIQREKTFLGFHYTTTEYYPYERFVIYIDIKW